MNDIVASSLILSTDTAKSLHVYLVNSGWKPIKVHERTAICESQLEAIIKNTGNTRGNNLLVAGSQTNYTGV